MEESDLLARYAPDAEMLRTWAHSRITWGDKPDAVRRGLMVRGASAAQAQNILDPLITARRAEVRRRARGNLAVGAPLAILGWWWAVQYEPTWPGVALGLVGLVIAAYGIARLITGGRGEGSLSASD